MEKFSASKLYFNPWSYYCRRDYSGGGACLLTMPGRPGWALCCLCHCLYGHCCFTSLNYRWLYTRWAWWQEIFKNNFGGKNSNLFFGGPSGSAMVMGPMLPVSLLVWPLLPHLSKLPATVHPVGLMAGNLKNNFGGKNSNLFFWRAESLGNGHWPCAACVTACTATVASPF